MLRDVAAKRHGLAAVGGDRVGRCAGGVFVDVAAHDAATTLGEFDGEGGADTAARTGDDGGGVAAALVRSEDSHADYPAALSMRCRAGRAR